MRIFNYLINYYAMRIYDQWRYSFTPQHLYLLGYSTRFPLHRKLGGPHIRSGRYDEKISPFPVTESLLFSP
jgi:hypothetical protein